MLLSHYLDCLDSDKVEISVDQCARVIIVLCFVVLADF